MLLRLVNEYTFDRKGTTQIKPEKFVDDERNSSRLANKVNRAFWIALGCWSAYNLIDHGLASFLALETLTHGTGPLGYIGINIYGADPSFGGGDTGSSVGRGSDKFINNSKNYFYVFKDSEFEPVGSTLFPRMHAALSGMAHFGYSEQLNRGNILQQFIGGAVGLLIPTLKFKFTPEEVLNCKDSCRFENDPDYGRMAYRTSKPISASHLGITGSLTQGINAGALSRMSARPGKVLLGIALLASAAQVARKTYKYFKTPPQKVATESLPNDLSYFQRYKKTIKGIAVKSCWTAVAVTAIFLNTL